MKFNNINEAAYKGNMGFEEMMKFYRVASKEDKEKMEKLVKDNNWSAYKILIKRVLGVQLQ
jgi:hypothetical protein